MLGILCGFAAEAAVAKKLSPLVACSGAVEENAFKQAKQLVENGATALLSFGVAGALRAGLTPHDVIVPTHVLAADGQKWTCDKNLTRALMEAAALAHGGDVYGSRLLVPTPQEKRRIYNETGAAIVDMESHVVAQMALHTNIPFAVLRGVSDAVDDTFPDAALRGLNLDGSNNSRAVALSLLANPFQIPALLRLFKHTHQSLAALHEVVGRIKMA